MKHIPELNAPEFEPKAVQDKELEPRHAFMQIRTTSAEMELIRLAAYQDGRSVSSWVRWTAIKALGGYK